MTERIERMLQRLRARDYRSLRVDGLTVTDADLKDLPTVAETFRRLAESETPVLFEDDSLGFNRHTRTNFSYSRGNITPNYGRVITDGFDQTAADIRRAIAATDDEDKKTYGALMLDMLASAGRIAENYREAAKTAGNEALYAALSNIPHRGAQTYYEALVFLKFCVFFLRLSGLPHLTFGRFDQYMYPFFRNSRAAGATDAELFELTEEFFVSINYDTDLYFGMQQGDNGQSMVLGGFDMHGNDMYNDLSKMCMDASLELSLIDPKINLRVGKRTPRERYEYATRLTKKGLGFPQYCNDDIAVAGLIKLGYDPEDAYNYTVAACWEYIVPNCAMDVPNITNMNFPLITGNAIRKTLAESRDFDELMTHVRAAIIAECDRLIEKYSHFSIGKSVLLSVFVDGCIEHLTDALDHGGKYMNFGAHGSGIANASDALAAIKKLVFEEKTVSAQTLLDALNANYEGYTELRNAIKNCPKMGNNDDYVDSIALDLMDTYASYLNGHPNGFGGIWRAGTGSALGYVSSARNCPATADGRRDGDPYSSSFSPSLDVRPDGLLSVLSSFTKYDMTNIINGGPLTIEIHDTVLRNDIGIQKTAALVRRFIEMGGHQLQINSVNREILLDAQKHPENYPNLIVRVWGWSGYFNELDVEYQNHIIRRCEFLV